MTITPTADPLAHLDAQFDHDLARMLDTQLEFEPELWWQGPHTAERVPCWSVAFAMDLIGVVDCREGDFPFVVLGDVRSERWMQVCGTPEVGYLVELGNVERDTNTMGIVGRPGGYTGGDTRVTITGTEHSVTCRSRQVLTVGEARFAFSSWVVDGKLPLTDFWVEYVTY